MLSAISSIFLLAFCTGALPVKRDSNCIVPSAYAEEYLEDYCAYHERYLALGCQDNHNTTFFDDCCHPLLATESLTDDRQVYCNPSTSTSSAEVATPTSSDTVDAGNYGYASSYTADTSFSTPTTTVDSGATTTSSSEGSVSSTSSSSSSGAYSGTATFYYQNGNAGACGDYHSDSDYIVAIPYALWGDENTVSANCGKSVTLTDTSTGKSVSAVVADLCPTCEGEYSIDLSVATFTSLASESDGTFPVSYTLS